MGWREIEKGGVKFELDLSYQSTLNTDPLRTQWNILRDKQWEEVQWLLVLYLQFHVD